MEVLCLALEPQKVVILPKMELKTWPNLVKCCIFGMIIYGIQKDGQYSKVVNYWSSEKDNSKNKELYFVLSSLFRTLRLSSYFCAQQ